MSIDQIVEAFRAYSPYVLFFVGLVTPVFRAAMASAHSFARYAANTQGDGDDKIAAKLVLYTESICGTLAKVSAFIPRITMSQVKR